MPSIRTLQQSFVGGELAPEMLPRVEDVTVQNGCKRLRNCIASPRGSAAMRPGFAHVADTKFQKATRLEEFAYSNDQTVVIEMGDYYFRFHTLGATLLFEAPSGVGAYQAQQNITGGNAATDTVIFASPHGLTENQRVEVRATGLIIVGLEEAELYWVRVVDATTIAFRQYPDGPDVDITSFPGGGSNVTTVYRAYEAGDVVQYAGQFAQCTAERPLGVTPASAPAFWELFDADDIYEISSPYSAAELFDIVLSRDTQSGDVITLTHPNHAASELRRLGPSHWTFQAIDYGPTLEPPVSVVPSKVDGQGYDFTVEHELPGPAGDLRIALPTGGGGLVPAKESGYTNGTYVDISAPGYTYVPDGQPFSRRFVVYNDTPGTSNQFEIALEGTGTIVQIGDLSPAPTVGVTIVGRVGRAYEVALTIINAYVVTAVDERGIESTSSVEVGVENNLYVPGASNTITFSAVAGAKRYRVYKRLNGLFGLIGEVDADQALSLTDDNIDPDLGFNPPLRDDGVDSYESQISWDATNNRVLWPGNELQDGAEVSFDSNGTIEPGVTAGESYYVRSRTKLGFEIAATPGGAAVAIAGGSLGLQFARSGDHARAFSFYEQRGVLAGTRENPSRMLMTRPGTRSDLSFSLPPKDDDRISIDIAARSAIEIRHLVPLADLVVLTSGVEFLVSRSGDGALSGSTVSVRAQSEVGASRVTPLVASNVVLFCGARDKHVYALAFQAASQRFEPFNVSARATHLFEGRDLIDSAQMRAPHAVEWWVSSSGELLGLTFMPQERVAGWHVHDTDGKFESCAAVAEGDEDRLYVVVDRIRNGVAVKSIERMAPQRRPADMADLFFVDAGLTFDGTNTGATTITVDEGTSWGRGDELRLQASTAIFTLGPTDVGDQIVLTAAGERYRVTISKVESTTIARGFVDEKLPVALQNVAVTDWAWARDHLSGLESLEGAEVAILADGVVLPRVTIEDGVLALDEPAVKVHVGRPYVADLIPRDPAFAIDGFGRGRNKNVAEAWVDVVDTAALEIGPDEARLKGARDLDPSKLTTGEVRVTQATKWTDDGELLLRQKSPLPMTVSGLTLRVAIGG